MAKGQLGYVNYSYTFWTMSIMRFSPVENFGDQSLYQRSVWKCTPKHVTSQPVLPYLQNWRLSIQFWLFWFCCYDPLSTLARRVPVNQVERIVSDDLLSFFFGGSKLVKNFKHYQTKFDQNNQFFFLVCFCVYQAKNVGPVFWPPSHGSILYLFGTYCTWNSYATRGSQICNCNIKFSNKKV